MKHFQIPELQAKPAWDTAQLKDGAENAVVWKCPRCEFVAKNLGEGLEHIAICYVEVSVVKQ